MDGKPGTEPRHRAVRRLSRFRCAKEDVMKWLGAAAVLCLAVGALMFFPGRQERACFRNLTTFDHALNCSCWVHLHEQEGIVSNGVWTQKGPVLEGYSKERLRCPITGKDYVLTFTVGEHPYCPVHGRLIEKYDFRPHNQGRLYPPSVKVRLIAGFLSLLLGFLLAATTGLVALARRSRTQGKTAQPSDGSGAAGDSERRAE